MQPQTLLSLLVGAAVAAGGILQGLQWKRVASATAGDDTLDRIAELEHEVDLLTRENESLRSLAQGGGELKVPAELIGFVQNGFGLDFKSSPVVHQIAGEELRDRVTASIESRFPPNGLDDRQLAWSLMGLLAPEDNFAMQLAATRSIGARSWFDDQTGEAWVTNRFDSGSVPDQSALVRVLGRILLHQHHSPPPGYPGDEVDRSREALHHGAAMAVESRFLARQAVGLGFAGSQVDSGAGDLLASLPTFVNGLATFPSQNGTPCAERLMNQMKLGEVLHDPPTNTSWFFPDCQDLETKDPVLPDAGDHSVIEESAGMLGLQLWLQTINPELTPLARSWRGDRYRLSATDDSLLSLVWDIRLDSEESADQMLNAALTLAGALADAATDPQSGEIASSPDGRQLSATKVSSTTIRFRNQAPGK